MTKHTEAEVSYAFAAGAEPVVAPPKRLPRIGIYSSGFDPVHAGHIAFALKSQKMAGLEQVYFVPERRPVANDEPEHYVHRSVMLSNALRPYPQFSLLEMPDARLTARSLARIFGSLPEVECSLLTAASDLLWHQGELPAFYHKLHLIIAVTSHKQMAEVLARLTEDSRPFGNITFVDLSNEHVSSAAVRTALRSGKSMRGVLPSVWRYAKKQWLYISPHR
ncbi:MAG TPA: hypothetical protein VLG92_01080 [Candidatus Saccharimonadia bacterium]|nr:hypothetical protein [Candidatus Saccharimonadia bacterium]